jgi:hypothetical protein
VARHGAVLSFGRALTDHDLGTDERFVASTGPGSGHAQRPPGQQARGQLTAQRAPALDVERLIDGLVRDRIESSSANSIRSRLAICSGLQDLAQRRSLRRP